jgi:hypothetical protein
LRRRPGHQSGVRPHQPTFTSSITPGLSCVSDLAAVRPFLQELHLFSALETWRKSYSRQPRSFRARRDDRIEAVAFWLSLRRKVQRFASLLECFALGECSNYFRNAGCALPKSQITKRVRDLKVDKKSTTDLSKNITASGFSARRDRFSLTASRQMNYFGYINRSTASLMLAFQEVYVEGAKCTPSSADSTDASGSARCSNCFKTALYSPASATP